MLTLGLTGRIWVAVASVDARKSFDTLAAVVTATRCPATCRVRQPEAGLAGHPGLAGDRFALLRRRLEKDTFALPW